MSSACAPRTFHSSGFVVLDLLVANGTLTPHVGGTAANVAINLALLGWETSVSALLGDDPAGHTAREQLASFGVDTTGVQNRKDVTTPVVIHEVVKSRHRFRFSCPACGAKYAKFRPLAPETSKLAPRASTYFFDRASSYAIRLAGDRRDESAIVFEPGTPGRPAATKTMADTAHLLRVSSELGLDAVMSAVNSNTQVVGLGADGVRYRTPTDPAWRHRPSQVTDPVIDPGGAGDWLTAGIIDGLGANLIRSESTSTAELDDAIDRGLRLAAACCASPGTRGLIGTASWADLAAEFGVSTAHVRREPGATHVTGSQTCAAWFHS